MRAEWWYCETRDWTDKVGDNSDLYHHHSEDDIDSRFFLAEVVPALILNFRVQSLNLYAEIAFCRGFLKPQTEGGC